MIGLQAFWEHLKKQKKRRPKTIDILERELGIVDADGLDPELEEYRFERVRNKKAELKKHTVFADRRR